MFDGAITNEERDKVRSSLLQYCAMDTQALAVVVERLFSLSGQR